MHDLIIIGGGPAGLTATVYAIRKRLDALLITKNLGGKTNYSLQLPYVERHQVISGREVVDRFASQIEYLEFARSFDAVEKVEARGRGYVVHTRGRKSHEARALIVATGARGQVMDVPGEQEFMMRGLCYSAVSYAQLFIDRQAAVVGDAGLALRGAAELAQIARHVYLVAPSHGELDSRLGQRLQQAENVTVLEGYRVREVKGDRYARSLVVDRNGERRELEVDAIFVELGLLPNSGPVAHLVELDEKGHIKVDSANRTSRPGIFAAGDVTNVYAEQVLIAIGEGAKAALSAYEYLLQQ
ncbi:MAG: NAD(P)/FAD-dependent oxidoreductase [Anaerolineae bacterium]